MTVPEADHEQADGDSLRALPCLTRPPHRCNDRVIFFAAEIQFRR